MEFGGRDLTGVGSCLPAPFCFGSNVNMVGVDKTKGEVELSD